jgi:hypothetical protein
MPTNYFIIPFFLKRSTQNGALLNPFLEDYVLHMPTVHFYVQSSPTKNIHLNWTIDIWHTYVKNVETGQFCYAGLEGDLTMTNSTAQLHRSGQSGHPFANHYREQGSSDILFEIILNSFYNNSIILLLFMQDKFIK